MINQREFCKRMMQKGYTRRDAEVVVRDVLSTLTDTLISGEGIHFRGFGRFEIKEHSGRTCIAPTTKELVEVPPFKVVKFTCGDLLKKSIKEGFARQ